MDATFDLRELTDRVLATLSAIDERAPHQSTPLALLAALEVMSSWSIAAGLTSSTLRSQCLDAHDDCIRACERLASMFGLTGTPALASDLEYEARREQEEHAATLRTIALSAADDEFASLGD